MTDAWAIIIGAIIGAIGTIVATRFDDIVNLVRRSARSVEGEWDVVSFSVKADANGKVKRKWIGEYIADLKQVGNKVRGKMTATKVAGNFKPYTYIWKGEVTGDYLMYECAGAERSQFMVSTALLYLSTPGEQMTGYFVANSGPDKPERTWIGYSEMTRRSPVAGKN